MASEYATEPVLFVAVNSGNSHASVSSYIFQNHVPWPVLVDTSREFEKACGLNEISLQNIHQLYYISGDGQLKQGHWNDIEESVQTALHDATWRIDPESMPPKLMAAWNAVETGKYSDAADDLKAALRSKDEEVRTAAKSLEKVVIADLRRDGKAAWDLGKAGKQWEAYEAINAMSITFKGYHLPEKLLATRDKLAELPAIQSQIRAQKMMVAIEKMAKSRNPKLVQRAYKQLKLVIARYPETKSADVARKALEEVSGGT